MSEPTVDEIVADLRLCIDALEGRDGADVQTILSECGRRLAAMTCGVCGRIGCSDPHSLDFPTAWAIQNEVGETLEHDPRCSSVPGWNPLSGPGLLCDCGAVQREHERRSR